MTPSETKILLDCLPKNILYTDYQYWIFVGYILFNCDSISYNEGYKLWLKLTLKSPYCNSLNINEFINCCYNNWPMINKIVDQYYNNDHYHNIIKNLSIMSLEDDAKLYNPEKYNTYYEYGLKILTVKKWANEQINNNLSLGDYYNKFKKDINSNITKKCFKTILKESFPNKIYIKNNVTYIRSFKNNVKKMILKKKKF